MQARDVKAPRNSSAEIFTLFTLRALASINYDDDEPDDDEEEDLELGPTDADDGWD